MTYHLKNISKLLNDVFNEQDLRDFCFFEADFRPVHDQLREQDRKLEILRRLLEFAEQKNLLGAILAWAKAANAAKYQVYQPYETDPSTKNPPDDKLSPEAHASPDTYSQELVTLKEALARRSLILFIGADLPQTVTGLPARADLARELARRKGLDEALTLAEITQRVSQGGNRWEFTDFIRARLDPTGCLPQQFHQRLVTLMKASRIETILTTAYDNLLEIAFQQAGFGLNRVVRGDDLNLTNPDRPTLIKLYGDIQQADSLIVTDLDHSNLLRDRGKEPLLEAIKSTFRQNTVLFIGYNFADPDFRYLFDQIAESRFARTAYAVWPGLPPVDVSMWRDRGLVVMELDPLYTLKELTPKALE